ncbi:phosphonate metabolism protein/1,5-bisphosphokinase (PRPP-forming) PhnN [Motilimonas pumila]|uniref:phosphonate metabolism protein/1,5-bisphosphokinase (PRPP-forming) PhnN n=1 Tax=Motilimonas pumila TaxID=2303987 RepID=UPI0013142673|nr:phosphonate metabolism protein/1,5-bisphosphokinase (PRPP-forming) PhnN [Motilimonas pumila]
MNIGQENNHHDCRTQHCPTPKLYYLVGPSGSGKDSLINALKQQTDINARLAFARRYITREQGVGEEGHIHLTPQEFTQRLEQGFFAMYWQANDCMYGISQQSINLLQQGKSVLVNGSRAYLPTVQAHYGDKLQVIALSVQQDILAQRLTQRARECQAKIAARLERNHEFESRLPDGSWLIDNSGDFAQAVHQLRQYLFTSLPSSAYKSRAEEIK